MKFEPTSYQLMNVGTGRIFEDGEWTLADPQAPSPSLVRAVYANKQFTPRKELDGLYCQLFFAPAASSAALSTASWIRTARGSSAQPGT